MNRYRLRTEDVPVESVTGHLVGMQPASTIPSVSSLNVAWFRYPGDMSEVLNTCRGNLADRQKGTPMKILQVELTRFATLNVVSV